MDLNSPLHEDYDFDEVIDSDWDDISKSNIEELNSNPDFINHLSEVLEDKDLEAQKYIVLPKIFKKVITYQIDADIVITYRELNLLDTALILKWLYRLEFDSIDTTIWFLEQVPGLIETESISEDQLDIILTLAEENTSYDDFFQLVSEISKSYREEVYALVAKKIGDYSEEYFGYLSEDNQYLLLEILKEYLQKKPRTTILYSFISHNRRAILEYINYSGYHKDFYDILSASRGSDAVSKQRSFSKTDVFYTKLLKYMQIKNLDFIKREDLLSKDSALYKQFGVFAEAKTLQKYPKITQGVLESLIKEESTSDKYEVSYNTSYRPSNPTELKNNFSTVVISFTDKYLHQLMPDPELRDDYEELAEKALKHDHIVLPVPGKSLGWIRVEEIDSDTWIISEIQSDWGKIHRWAKKQDIDLGNHYDELREIITTLLENYDETMMYAILDIARKKGIKHLYMRDSSHPEVVSRSSEDGILMKMLYEKTPKKFRFHKVREKLEGSKYNPEYYWYRTARKAL